MRKYSVTNESSEDTFGTTDDLQKAFSIAKEVAASGAAGDLVLVECEGRGVRQFVRLQDGSVAEKKVA